MTEGELLERKRLRLEAGSLEDMSTFRAQGGDGLPVRRLEVRVRGLIV